MQSRETTTQSRETTTQSRETTMQSHKPCHTEERTEQNRRESKREHTGKLSYPIENTWKSRAKARRTDAVSLSFLAKKRESAQCTDRFTQQKRKRMPLGHLERM